MGRKKRTVATRSRPAIPAVNPPPALFTAVNGDGNGDVNGNVDDEVSSLSTELNLSNMSLSLNLENEQEIQQHLDLENSEVLLGMESESYSALKLECEKALNAIRRGNHMKAIRLMKDLCAKHENDRASLALICRVQATVCVTVAGIIDDPNNSKQRYLKNAVESAKKAAVLSSCSVEFAHFYANLLCETATEGKEYEESVRECDRALAIKNPIDPGKESLQVESQLKISVPEGRIEHVHNELRALHQRANIGIIVCTSGLVPHLAHNDQIPQRKPWS